MEGFFPSSGVQRWTLNALMFSVPAAALYASPAPIVELAGSLNAAIASCRTLAVPLVHARLGRERLNVVGHRLQLHGTVVDAGLAAVVHPDHRVLQPVLDPYVGPAGDHLVEVFAALVETLLGAEHRAVVLHSTLHVEAELRRTGAARGVAQAVKAGDRLLAGLRQLLVRLTRRHQLGGAVGGGTAEH